MKRFGFIVLIGLMWSNIDVHAQKFSMGVKAGLNVANQTVSGNGTSGSVSNRYGFHGGLFAVIKFNENIGLQPEVLYSMQGWHADLLGNSFSLNMDYISIPVLFRYNATPIFHIDAGPQLGFLMSAKASLAGTTNDVREAYHDVDWGMGFGLGVDLPAKVTFGFRYVLGISDVDKADNFTSKNTTVQFSVGYKM